MSTVDLLILTAANSVQAGAYEAQLRMRQAWGALDQVGAWAVLPDPGGRRVGSGAATINALAFAAKRFGRPGAARFADVFAKKRVMILHSGGDSRRLPAYAAQGKIFAPLPCSCADGRAADLFDLVFEDTAALLAGADAAAGCVVIAAGDLLLNLAKDLPNVARRGVVGIGCPSEYERASRHGVYIAGADGIVQKFLQKPTKAAADAAGAAMEDGRYLVDTGVVSLDPEAAEKWLGAAGAEWRGGDGVVLPANSPAAMMDAGTCPMIDLYVHMLMAHAAGMSEEEYFANVGAGTETERAVIRRFYEGLHQTGMTVATANDCEFLHIGSTREYMKIVGDPDRFDRPDFRSTEHPGCIQCEDSDDHPRGLDGVGGFKIKPRALVVVEGSVVGDNSDAAFFDCKGDAQIVGIPAVRGAKTLLPKNTGIVCLPVGKNDWCIAAFGLDDDCKTDAAAGGTFMGRPLSQLGAALRVRDEAIWSGDGERTLWTAALWRTGSVVKGLQQVGDLAAGLPAPPDWKAAKRLSLQSLMAEVNHERLLAHRARMRAASRSSVAEYLVPLCEDCDLRSLIKDVIVARKVEKVFDHSRERLIMLVKENSAGAMSDTGAQVGAFNAFGTARLTRMISLIEEMVPRRRAISPTPHDLPSTLVRQVLWRGEEMAAEPPRLTIEMGQTVRAASPVRIDLMGGWSDTPPICHERGGRVINMAVNIEGQSPVVATVQRIEKPEIRLRSVDHNEQCVLQAWTELNSWIKPGDWTMLPRAALMLCGLIPSEMDADVNERLGGAGGGGLEITLSSLLPKGSGLGTSSILGATLLAALDRAIGLEMDLNSIIRRTSILEQMMSTAGGWQDQSGGIRPGIKYLETKPGMDQLPDSQELKVGPRCAAMLTERSMLYYTGYQRLAKNILSNVVNRYLERDRGCLRIVAQLREGAAAMREAIAVDDAEQFAAGVLEYWSLKKAIDPGATNPRIEELIAPVAEHLAAYELPGAGGGGFIFMIARDVEAGRRVREKLGGKPGKGGARFFEYGIDTQGLRVS